MHRGGRSLEGRQIGTAAPRQPVAQDPIDQAVGRRRGDRWRRKRYAAAPSPSPSAAAAADHDDDDAATSAAAARRPDRDRRRRIRATRLGRGHPFRELQATDVQVHKRGAQRWLVRLVGREAKEVER